MTKHRSHYEAPEEFGRMFPKNENQLPDRQLEEIGRSMGGGCEDDNEDIASGYTYLGQFIDHDITFEPTSRLGQQNDLTALENFRTPVFELDSLYGSGPAVNPFLYDQQNRGRFLLDQGRPFDLPRNSQGVALIADPRNDENLIIAQLHLAFLNFHNAVYQWADYPALKQDNETRFETAQRLVRWHYQWILLHDYLEQTISKNIYEEYCSLIRKSETASTICQHLKFYKFDLQQGQPPVIPVEFSVAAFRFGHSQVRTHYRLNDNLELGALPLFSERESQDERRDLRGGRIEERFTVNWKNFFNTGAAPSPGVIREGNNSKASKKIDTKLPGPLHHLPETLVPGPRRSLAVRNLIRGKDRKLASGQDAAKAMNVLKPLDDTELWAPPLEKFRGEHAPLWYYILKESEIREQGKRLGEVGSRIVMEVFLGLLCADSKSYLRKQHDWKPGIDSPQDDFKIVDLLRYAGAPTM